MSSVDTLLGQAIALVNTGARPAARALCEQAVRGHPPHPAVHQLLALLCLQDGDAEAAGRHADLSMALRPDHGPTLLVAGDAARARGALAMAMAFHRRARDILPDRPDAAWALALTAIASTDGVAAERALGSVVALQPDHADAWFRLALLRQDRRDWDGAATALRQVLALQPERVEAEVNLGIVLQDAGHTEEALRAYGRAFRRRPETFGRIAHALAAAPHGEVWLDLDGLRRVLAETR